MVELKTLKFFLNQLLPQDGLMDYCLNGLQVEGKELIESIATAVTASQATIEAAIEKGVDALIVHHGLFWQRDSYAIEGSKKLKLEALLNHGISLFAYHLPLDKHLFLGNNWKAAHDLGWTDLHPFGLINEIPIGVKGKIAPIKRDVLQSRLEIYYQHPAACALGGPEIIETLALVSGGAHKSILEAADQGLDAFITGSFDEPVWHQAFEEKINFFALGHSATEKIGPLALTEYIEKELGLPCHFLDVVNPF